MTLSMYHASVPVFTQLLNSLSTILEKASIHAIDQGIDPNELLQASLFKDMFNLTRQIQIASDFAKGVSARLAGIEVPAYEDNETSFEALEARLSKTRLFIASISPNLIDGSEEREIITRPGTPKEKNFKGQHYVLHYGIPQFFFHTTTAYDILRSQGVNLGKADYMGVF